MAKQELYNSSVSEVTKGVYLDCDPLNQPKNTRRFTLNAVEENLDGNNKVSNEPSNYSCDNFADGFHPIGDVYIGNDDSLVILTNPTTGIDHIGILDKNNKFNLYIETGVLKLKITNQCDVIFRIRRGKERVIYWVDALNNARTVNLDRLHNFYNTTYNTYIKNGGDPNTYVGEKWDYASFELIKIFSSVPFFNKAEIIENGNILPGSYNFAVQYVDEDLNPTAWITTSNTINIFNDTITNPYERIRGSRNVTSSSQSWGRANKSIKLTLGNLDNSFPYYRIAIIRAAGGNGEPDKTLASDLYSTDNSTFIYTGNDSELTQTAIEDILIDHEVIYSPKHISQLENKLILANTKGKSINWCDFQKFASKIKTDLVTKQVVLNSIDSDGNVKNSNSTFILNGYLPGEVASFGISYLFDDGYIAPNFHIPGKNILNTTSLMKYYEIDNKYLDIHNCSTNNYWGLDALGKTLVGKNIRHHRFPFRKEVNKPLVTTNTSSTNITRYRIKANITLNPAWTPGPIIYPNVSGVPIVIGYTFNYQVTGAGSTYNISGEITDTSMGQDIIIYDDSSTINTISGAYGQLDTSSQLYTYQGGTNDRFIITYTYDNYILSSNINSDVSEVFGISFSNIEKPHPNVVGFYITKNEITDEDRLIIDNGIIGATTEFQQYVSFGLINPKQYYNVNNCGSTASSGKTLVYNNQTLWFFNPEFQYFNKKITFDNIEVEGKYDEVSVNMPTISDTDNSFCNSGGSKGVYIQDVQAGTSYNPSVNKAKNKDDDGFDLIIGYRNSNMQFNIDTGLVFPGINKILYLNAASYQNIASKTYYNVSVDNKIGLILTDTTFDTEQLYNSTTKKNSLIYASLTRDNTSAYSNFMSRPYFKEHNNPVLFGTSNVINNFEVYNGGSKISGMNFVSTVYYDTVTAERVKKNKLLQIILGIQLVVGAIVLTIVTAGAAAPVLAPMAIAAIGSLAISYGVSLVMSGIKFDQLKSMIDTDYEKGLVDTVTDGGVFETIRNTINRQDDTIRWFSDRASNIYIESIVPFGLRSGFTTGVTDFVDGPALYNELEFRSYLTEKLTTLDVDQAAGRLYRGFASAEIYDMNPDFMRFNKQKEYIHLSIEYDCCADFNETFPLRRWYSQQSFQEEITDNYRVFLPNNYSDMEGEHGEITGLVRLGNNIYMYTSEALWQQPANLQERVTSEIVSFIGTGEFLAIPPRKVVDDSLGSGGTQHKWATIKTKNGIGYISESEHIIFIYGNTIKDSNKGLNAYFNTNIQPFLSKQLYSNFGIAFLNTNNPANINGTGYLSTYDTRFDRIIFTKKDYLIVDTKLAILTIINNIPTTGNLFTFCTVDNQFYQGLNVVNLENKDYFINKSFTVSYSFHTDNWTGWHNYLPNYYIRSKNSLYSNIYSLSDIWKHNQEGSYGNFYGIQYPFIIEKVNIINPLRDQILEDLTIQTNARQYNINTNSYINKRYITFNKIWIYNNTQHSGEQILSVKELQNLSTWYENQTTNTSGSIIISKEGEDWNLNGFRNYVGDYDKTIFTYSWDILKSNYYIDKAINPDAINLNKNWYELETFKDKFVVIRLIFDNFNNINLGMNYILDTEQTKE